MRIVCLGWGSLIWNREKLPIASEPNAWRDDGPELPVEFARQSSGDRLTLVLMGAGPTSRMLWTEMGVLDLACARQCLAVREKSAIKRIGVWPGGPGYAHEDTISDWARNKNIDGVVWTALGPKYDGQDDVAPTEAEALAYLRGLIAAGTSGYAEEYVRKAPAQIRTPYRSAMEREFGWTPLA